MQRRVQRGRCNRQLRGQPGGGGPLARRLLRAARAGTARLACQPAGVYAAPRPVRLDTPHDVRCP